MVRNMEDLLSEYNLKKDRLFEYMDKKNIGGLLLAKRSNYAWLMCGRTNRIVDTSESGGAILLLCRDRLYLVTTNIELERMKNEESNDFNFLKFIQYDWFEPQGLENKISEIIDLNKIRQDFPILPNIRLSDPDLEKVKYCLTDNEKERYCRLGNISSECVTKTCSEIKPGMTEFQVHGILSQHLLSEGIIPALILVGSDERLFNYRHPISTCKKIDKYVMVVTSAMKWGLNAALSRIVHFGKPSNEIITARDIITYIDSEMILSSRSGVKYSDILKTEIKNFEKYKLKNEWKNHHQGGPIGYEGRYFCVSQDNDEFIANNHAIAWNPSMRGFKSEDTIIVEENNNGIITQDNNWPMIKVETDSGTTSRPDILIK
jgi:Xaa-Pro dipeptidase